MADRTVTLTASLTPEEGGYVARCLELGVTTEGDTLEEALAMLREAVELYLEDEPLGGPPPPSPRLGRSHAPDKDTRPSAKSQPRPQRG
ncbi:MAG: type II toxin-antitoxin system HicB family antitoxin [Streptosporangiaceae bacterium]